MLINVVLINITSRTTPLIMEYSNTGLTKPAKRETINRLCIAFAEAVTVRSLNSMDWVARKGDHSVFSALCCIFPEVMNSPWNEEWRPLDRNSLLVVLLVADSSASTESSKSRREDRMFGVE